MIEFFNKESQPTEICSSHNNELLRRAERLEHTFIDIGQLDEGKFLQKNLLQAGDLIHYFEVEMARHTEVEESTLFPYVGKHIPKMKTLIYILSFEHEDITSRISYIKNLIKTYAGVANSNFNRATCDHLQEVGLYLVRLLRHHLNEESNRVYSVLTHELRENESLELKSLIQDRFKKNKSGGSDHDKSSKD